MKMVEPEKPFACSTPECGMTFTNEDHLNVHTRKHDMSLQLGFDQKAAFVADQTPTPTRFIRNCEEVGLFQDLQNVNPFEEGFKRAMETCKHGLLSLEGTVPSSISDDLHTPQMVFPLDPVDATLYTTANNHKNITISRSSSDESGTIKEYETTTISKLTNKVTTISRLVNKHDLLEKTHPVDEVITLKTDDNLKHNERSVSFTNNVIQIHNNIEIRKDNVINVETTKTIPANVVHYDTVIKDANSVITKDVLLANANKTHVDTQSPPIMSQKSIDHVVNSLTSDVCQDILHKKDNISQKNRKIPNQPVFSNPIVTKDVTNTDKVTNNDEPNPTEDYEVIIKLPNGKQFRMVAADEKVPEEVTNAKTTKEKLKIAINKKVSQNNAKSSLHTFAPKVINTIPSNITLHDLNNMTAVQKIMPITAGTLIPVTLVNPPQIIPKLPIAAFNVISNSKPGQEYKTDRKTELKKTVKRKTNTVLDSKKKLVNDNINVNDKSKRRNSDCVIVSDVDSPEPKKKSREDLDSRMAASRRYRVRLKETMEKQVNEIKRLQEANQRLVAQQDQVKQLRQDNQRLAAEKVLLEILINEHLKKCPSAAGDFRKLQDDMGVT